MTEPSFNFISINLPNPKPRSKGVTCVTDVMWTTSMMDDYLNDFEDIIDAKVVDVTEKAKEMGIKKGMKGYQVLEIYSDNRD